MEHVIATAAAIASFAVDVVIGSWLHEKTEGGN